MKESSEEKIKQILKSKINIPSGYVDAINTAFIKKGKSNHFIKILTTTCAGIILTSGIVLAGYNIYQKIWKEPEMVKNSDIEKSLENKEISKEDQEKLITTEEAKKKSLEILNALGYEELKIEEAELKNSNNTIYFDIKIVGNNKFNVLIDGKNGKLIGINNLNNIYNDISQISEMEAKEDSVYISENLKLDNEKYELNYCKEESSCYGEKQYKIWVASFNKKYDERYNPYDSMKIYFYESNKIIKLDSVIINKDENFQNNEIKISEDDAKSISIEKEKQLSQLEIIDIASELEIRKMNTYIFKLENNIDDANIDESNEETTIYKTENITRNVWIVRIKHNKPENINFSTSLEYNKQMDKKYYIDATTGEIIGGEDFFEKMNNPLYN